MANILSQYEIDSLLEVLDESVEQGAIWQHKDGGLYRVIKEHVIMFQEEPNERMTIVHKIPLVIYRGTCDNYDKIYVRTLSHFRQSFIDYSTVPQGATNNE